MTTRYLVVVFGDVDPILWGPYDTAEERFRAAKDHRQDDPEKRDGLFPLDIDEEGKPEIGSYFGGDLDDDEEAVAEEQEGAR